MARRWLHRLRVAYLPLAVLFIAWVVWRAMPELSSAARDLRMLPLLAAIGLATLAQWLAPAVTLWLGPAVGLRMSYTQAARIHLLRLPARYLPGGIWHSVARFTAYRDLQLGSGSGVGLILVEHLLALAISLVLGGVLLLLAGGRIEIGVTALLLGVLAVAGMRIVAGRRDEIDASQARFAAAAAATALYWLIAGAAFALYWYAVLGDSAASMLRVVAVYLLAWAVGFAAVFAPQGAGVFEVTAAWLSAGNDLPALYVAVAAGYRIIVLLGDCLAWLSGHLLVVHRHPPPGE